RWLWNEIHPQRYAGIQFASEPVHHRLEGCVRENDQLLRDVSASKHSLELVANSCRYGLPRDHQIEILVRNPASNFGSIVPRPHKEHGEDLSNVKSALQ